MTRVADKVRRKRIRKTHPETLAESTSARPEVLGERAIRRARGINWPVTIWLVLVHVIALAAPFTFTWEGLALCLFMHWGTGSVGVCIGYHGLLTHSSYKR